MISNAELTLSSARTSSKSADYFVPEVFEVLERMFLTPSERDPAP